jgi:hypothetical protein
VTELEQELEKKNNEISEKDQAIIELTLALDKSLSGALTQ